MIRTAPERQNYQAGFENGRRVPIVPARTDDEEFEEVPRDDHAREVLVRLSQWLADSRTTKAAGRRAWAMAYVLQHLPGTTTQRQLAALLGVSEGRASQLVDEIRTLIDRGPG